MHNNSAHADARLADWFFWLTAACLIFCNLGARALWGAEGRWAEVAREMILSGDLFHPTIAGLPYFDKPLGSYWLIVLTAPFTAGMNEWAVRLPSAFYALAALWAVRQLGAQLWSAATGRLAGWILLTIQGFLFWARTGSADMANLACSIVAVAWYWRRRERPTFSTFLVFYLLLFIGAQMKGLTAVVVPVLALAPDLLHERRWRRFFVRQHWPALGIGLLVYVLPFLYASFSRTDYSSSGIALVVQENIQRFFSPFDHIEPFYIYLKHVPVLCLPWSPLLLIGLVAAARRSGRAHYAWPDYWLAWAMLLIFLFFTASGSRRSYYILPILPYCALFCANSALGWGWTGQRRLTQFHTGLLALATIASLAFAAAWPLCKQRSGVLLPIGLGWIIACAAGLLALAWLPRLARPAVWLNATALPPPVMAWTATMAICMGGYFCVIQPMLEQYRTEKNFALEIKNTGRNASQTAFFENYLENVVFYLGMTQPANHKVITQPGAAYAYLHDEPGRILILRRKDLPRLLKAFPPERQGGAVLEEKTWHWETRREAGKKMVAWSL